MRRALGKLAQALRLFEKGNQFDARHRITAGVRAFLIAEQLGVTHQEARQALRTVEQELRGNDWFRGEILQAVGRERDYAGGWPHRDFRPPAEYQDPDRAVVASRGVISQPTRVTADRPERLNPRLIATESFGAMVQQASGLPSLNEHLELAADQALLFTGLLMEAIGESSFQELTSRYLADSRLPRPEPGASLGYLPLHGRALLASPLVRAELVIAGQFDRALEETHGWDTPDLWAHIGELWVEEARQEGARTPREPANHWASSLCETLDWREAHRSYIRSTDRFLHESEIPNWLHLAVADTGQKVLGAREILLGPLQQGDARLAAKLAEVDDRSLRRMAGELLVENFARNIAERVMDAYRHVIDRAPEIEAEAPPETEDLRYAQYATALARLSLFLDGLGRQQQARRMRNRLWESPGPANGHQYFHRGVVLWDLLGEEKKARADLVEAREMLAADSDLRAVQTLDAAHRYLERPVEGN